MSESGHVQASDVRAINELVGECCDLGDDPGLWWSHYSHGLARLIDGDFSSAWTICGLATREIEVGGIREWGWDNGFDQAGWKRSVAEFKGNPFYTPLHQRFFDRLEQEDGLCLARTGIMDDREWDHSWVYQNVSRVMGVDHFVSCYRALPLGTGQHSGVSVARVAARPNFSAREQAIIREAHARIALIVGERLARFDEPSPSELSPRVRQVLRCVLEGDGDKQIAARLGISRLTVNVHTKVIFRHFGVQSRAELLARWIRRKWGIGAWQPELK